ncbi:RMR6 [Symbiodinium natans]|uniref:RING-type E3 ubiquitin transferase n=1 Tax=Symbiodinium natans TaxID=878477 RepID=A0A812SLN4_9DINO|nr:RMR6 [Symbiodinium natans]
MALEIIVSVVLCGVVVSTPSAKAVRHMASSVPFLLVLALSPATILLILFAYFQKVGDGQHANRIRAFVAQSQQKHSKQLREKVQASARIEKATAQVTCIICLEDVESGQPVRRLRCGHLFHPDCICSWCCHKGDWAVLCPTCRDSEPLTGAGAADSAA